MNEKFEEWKKKYCQEVCENAKWEDDVRAAFEAGHKYALEQLNEALDELQDMAAQHCLRTDDGKFDSGGLSADAHTLRLLAKHGRFVIEREYGRMVVGCWAKPKEKTNA